MGMILSTVKITWMDEYTRTYENVTTSTRDGVLHVYQYSGKRGHGSEILHEWHFPLSNIRMWKPVAAGPGDQDQTE